MSDLKHVIHMVVEADRNMGDHARLTSIPMPVDLSMTLREVLDRAGDDVPGYYIKSKGIDRLRPENRIIITVRPLEEA